MSAWLLGDTHINALVEGAIRLGVTERSDAQKTGAMLRRANTTSIRARYGRSRFDTPETYGRPAYRYWTPRQPLSDVSLLKNVGCYDYQTCEYVAYERSTAARFVKRMEGALALRGVTRESPGYSEAPWGI